MKTYRTAIIRRLMIKRQLRKAGMTINPAELLDLHALRGLRRRMNDKSLGLTIEP